MKRTRPEPGMETWKKFDQNVITHSAAHHLMAIDELIGRLGYARVSDVARVLGITRGSVSISLQPLKKSGLVLQDENRHLRLSPDGQGLVDAIKIKRDLIRRLLAEVLEVPANQAEIDACKMEHLVSNQTAQAMVRLFRCLDADAPGGRDFLAALHQSTRACPQDAGGCPTCESDCLTEQLGDQ